ncbi:hypothetical protein [Mycobacterium riyadhense]|uniref:hypothetical protein n=1 Tax=Mycobacterium riyadhense TaxID=486698 RepID=UPI001959DA12|nr:hypothetical protein [Mycobacterium riyadhense]
MIADDVPPIDIDDVDYLYGLADRCRTTARQSLAGDDQGGSDLLSEIADSIEVNAAKLEQYLPDEESDIDRDGLDSDVRTIHEQVEASRATVDKGIAELLECVWAAGIDTQFSCQGGDPRADTGEPQPASIVFPTVRDALQFMHITMIRSYWHNRMSMDLAEPLPFMGDGCAIRASVSWPVTDPHTRRDITAALTDVWAHRQRDDDIFTRKALFGLNPKHWRL